MVTIYHVNDFFILFFSLLSLPLTHLTLFFSFPFSPHSHRSTFPHFIKLSHFIRSTLSPTNATDPSPIADLLVFFFSPSLICWLLVIFLLWWAISVGLFFRLCGFRLVTGVDLMWVLIVPMVAMWLFGLFQVCER